MTDLSTDARMILEYLNELGYRNITAQQLKEFIIDLKKLIKYEQKLGVNNFYDEIHRKSTVSSRARTKEKDISPVTAQTNLEHNQKRLTATSSVSAKTTTPLAVYNKNAPPARLSINIPTETQTTKNSQSGQTESNADKPTQQRHHVTDRICNENEKKKTTARSACSEQSSQPQSQKMWIRPNLKKSQSKPKGHDPVALYHYYQKEWDRFKKCLPGENSHSDLRWAIRQKLSGPK